MIVYFFAFEGVDGVGKTTLARKIADIFGAEYYKTPPEPYASRRAEADRAIPSLRFAFYLESMLYAMREVGQILRTGKLVVADRWMWSTLAYHFVLEPTLEPQWQRLGIAILEPDIVFFPYVQDQRVWLTRLQKRREGQGSSVSDEVIENDRQLQLRIRDLFLNLCPSLVCVENSGTVEETVDIITSIIQTRTACAINIGYTHE